MLDRKVVKKYLNEELSGISQPRIMENYMNLLLPTEGILFKMMQDKLCHHLKASASNNMTGMRLELRN